jgi:1,4-alpha-glucan branching enzyme
MRRDGADSVWKVSLPLKPGRYEYRFVVDGEWTSDPNARESAINDFGSTNSVLVV